MSDCQKQGEQVGREEWGNDWDMIYCHLEIQLRYDPGDNRL